jgi:integrase
VYDLRHTCATHWLNADIDIKIIADWLAHSPAVLLNTYAGVIKGSRERAVEIAASLHKTEE